LKPCFRAAPEGRASLAQHFTACGKSQVSYQDIASAMPQVKYVPGWTTKPELFRNLFSRAAWRATIDRWLTKVFPRPETWHLRLQRPLKQRHRQPQRHHRKNPQVNQVRNDRPQPRFLQQ